MTAPERACDAWDPDHLRPGDWRPTAPTHAIEGDDVRLLARVERRFPGGLRLWVDLPSARHARMVLWAMTREEQSMAWPG